MTPDLFKGQTVAQIEALLARHPRRPLLPPLGTEPWRKAAANPLVRQWLPPLRAKAEAECGEPLPVLTDALYADFAQTGIRLPFERIYFERRRRLGRAVIAILLCREEDPWRERLVASAIEKFTSVFEEVSWALPAHVRGETTDPTGKDPLEIDLFCAETANLMGEILDLLGAILPALLQERVRERLRRAIFENYLARTFGWETSTNNWNAVCHQGVLGAALSQVDDPRLLAALLDKARRHLPHFLNGFGPDGGCSEGPGYWSYGFGWFAVLNEQLETRTGGELSFFEGNEKIPAIALYGPRVCLPGGNLVNFADSGATGGLTPSLLAYLETRLNLPEMQAATQEQYRLLAAAGLNLDRERSDLFYLGRLFLQCPETLPAASAAEPGDCFLPNLAVLVAHGTDAKGHRWDFAAKAGHNGEHHNHNDCGSYLLNIDGVRLITEIGSPEYIGAFFSAKRYEFLAARTLGHSLPILNGCEQAEGAEYAARILHHSVGGDPVTFTVDATACYPAEAGCRSFLRTLRLEKAAGKLTLEDAFELTRLETLEDALITSQPVSLAQDHAVITAEGLALRICPLPGTRLDRVETLAYQNHDGQEAWIHRLVFLPERLAAHIRLGLEISLR